MNVKRFFCILPAFLFSWMAYASLCVEKVSYFQCPTQGVQYDYADVYLMQDKELANQLHLAQTDAWKRNEIVINKLTDAEGRFSVWRFVPNYIKRTVSTPNRLVVEIELLNDTALAQQKKVMTSENGAYLIPYRVHCKYRMVNAQGKIVTEKNYGWLEGYYITQNKDLAKQVLYVEKVGIQAAFSKVRQEIYSMYGFTTFDVPFRLTDFSEIPSISLLQNQVIEQIKNKKGLFLSKEAKEALMAYCDVLSYHKNKIATEKRPQALRNLALCKAWLGNPQAIDYWDQYAEQLKTAQDSLDYQSIDLFIRNYPLSQEKHVKTLRMIDKDLKWKVDAFTYNDLLSSIFSIAYPMPILPLEEMKGKPQFISGTITANGKEPIFYSIKYDKKNRIRSCDVHTIEYPEGKRNKLAVNTLHVDYKRSTGEYERIYCSNSELARFMTPGIEQMNYPVDAMQRLTWCKTDNLLGGFMKFKVSTEEQNQFSIDEEGNVYVKGTRTLSRPNLLLKEIADANGVKFPTMVSNNTADYELCLGFTEDGIVNNYQFNGYGLMEKNVGEDNYAYIKADSLKINIQQIKEETQDQAGALYHEMSMRIDTQTKDREKLDLTPLNQPVIMEELNSKLEEQNYYLSNHWIYRTNYDEVGNWNYFQVGPYTIKRVIRY